MRFLGYFGVKQGNTPEILGAKSINWKAPKPGLQVTQFAIHAFNWEKNKKKKFAT